MLFITFVSANCNSLEPKLKKIYSASQADNKQPAEREDYTIVVPVYNSESTIHSLFERISKLFESIDGSFKVVFVNDDSEDGSWKAIKHLQDLFPGRVRGINLSKNIGQHSATLCGIHHSYGDFVITIDDDLQIPPEEISKLLDKHKETEADLVYGIYAEKKHSAFRNAGSLMVNYLFKQFANTSGQGSSFRLITRTLAEKLNMMNQQYLLLDEVLSWHTSRIAYQQVEHHERMEGSSGYSVGKLILLTINYIISYTALPLRVITYIGFILSVITFFRGIYYIYQKMTYDVELGFTSLIVAILFSTSIILFSLGIIGEYIRRIYTQSDSRYHYSIKEIVE